jgi:hypothetical protein
VNRFSETSSESGVPFTQCTVRADPLPRAAETN